MAWSILGLMIIVVTVANIYWVSALMCQVLYIRHLICRPLVLRARGSAARYLVDNKQGRLWIYTGSAWSPAPPFTSSSVSRQVYQSGMHSAVKLKKTQRRVA